MINLRLVRFDIGTPIGTTGPLTWDGFNHLFEKHNDTCWLIIFQNDTEAEFCSDCENSGACFLPTQTNSSLQTKKIMGLLHCCQLIYSLDFSGILLGLLHRWWYVSTHILSCLMTRSFVDDASLSTKLFRSTTLPVMQRRRGRGWSSRKVCCWKTRQAVQTLHHPRLLLNETKSLKLASMAQLYISGQASLSSMVSPYQSCFMIRPNEFLHPMFWKKSNWSS